METSINDVADRDDGVTNEAAVGLPPLSATRKGIWAYYRLEFLDDGYPGRRTGDLLAPHPIYGTYVIMDYLGSFSRTRDPVYLDAARRVADAAVRRMEPLEDSLTFMYDPGTGISSMPHRFYSGLTQSRYLAVLSKLVQLGGDDRFREASRAILRSLLVPAERGGVLRRTTGGGAVIEEYAHAVPDYTLNGWTTATLLVADYARALQDPDAVQLAADSVQGIRDVLPLYDVPELANSRYRLGGPATVRLCLEGTSARIADMSVVIPRHGTYPVVHGSTAGRAESRVLRGLRPDGEVASEVGSGDVRDGEVPRSTVLAEVFLSRITWPTPNRITANITATSAGLLTAYIGQGDYQPRTKRLLPSTYERIAMVELAPGDNSIDVPITWDVAELIAYPTNFGKLYEGRPHNAYHFIHIDTLRRLARLTEDDMFGYYAARWASYVKRWPKMPLYADAGVVLEQYGSAQEAKAGS